ncbi:hypothetical protein Dsin_011723 [Dipteronia sinensis]|uniref:Endonuclease/exonuclease/phosphatase domain-containing protein n=1 Tax=Dipteronia sinensis TaxID=43782 RepID=A0AAE0AGN6_9ROSI|nr:hypothetical protein Dsin_011723 [Dipteronia sinensis]
MVIGLVTKLNPMILLIQETKLESYDSKLLRSLGGAVLSRRLYVEAEGASRGLVTLWNEEVFSVKACVSNKRCISLLGEILKFNKDVVFCNVYAPSVERERRELWEYLLDAQKSFPVPWCIGGDFNTVLDPAKRIGEGCDMSSVRRFNYVILQMGVVDIPLQRSKFTWSNNRVKEAWARLDRFIISPDILDWFPDLVQKCLPRRLSDHNSIMLGSLPVDWGPCPFRFYNWWMEDNDLMKEAIRGWKDCKRGGFKDIVLALKTRAVKSHIKRWLATKKSVSMSKDIEQKLADVDKKAGNDG